MRQNSPPERPLSGTPAAGATLFLREAIGLLLTLSLSSLLVAMIVFALMAFVGAASAQEFSMRPRASSFAPQSGNNAAANTMFSGARDLIDDAQWTKAEQKFAQDRILQFTHVSRPVMC